MHLNMRVRKGETALMPMHVLVKPFSVIAGLHTPPPPLICQRSPFLHVDKLLDGVSFLSVARLLLITIPPRGHGDVPVKISV